MATNYIGADVDCKMTELAVERKGKVVMRDRVPTDIRSISNFLRSLSGRKEMVIEESPMAGWLYRNLRHKVDKLVVCDPRRNKLISSDGDKSDAHDAGDLSALLRGGYLREVYHTDDPERLALKDMVALYHDRVRDAVRQINQLRAYGRCHGLTIPGRVVEDPARRGLWLEQLPSAIAKRLSIQWIGLDAVTKQVRMTRREMSRLSKAYSIIAHWRDLPGIGPIRAVTLFAYLDCPGRFATPKKLYKYCGIGLKRFASGSDKYGRPRPGKLRLFRHTNHKLKDAILGAALSAIGQSKNPFAAQYRRMLQNGVTESNARHTVARKVLIVMWGMWKTNGRYDESLV